MIHPVSGRERSFGISVGGVLTAIALVLAWRGRVERAQIVAAIGLSLVALGLLRPSWLAVPSRIWWTLAGALGWLNARVLLSLVFLFLLTPIGIVRRLYGRDALARRRSQFQGWSPAPARYRDAQHFKRMW